MRFEDAMRLSGLMPRDIVADGKWRRCATEDKPRKRNGAYVLHPDGRGFWRNWATDSDISAWRDDSTRTAAPVDQARIAAHRENERRQRIQATIDSLVAQSKDLVEVASVLGITRLTLVNP